MKIAVVGATGLVGRQILKELVCLGIADITAFASTKSAGKRLVEQGREFIVKGLTPEITFSDYQIALFSAGSETAKQYAPLFASAGCYVVDNSSCFRMDEDKALVVPEINGQAVFNYSKIIANPNCSTIQSVIAIKSLIEKLPVKAIDYVTYQAVSGSGVNGIMDLEREENQFYPRVIKQNVLPQIDQFSENGYTFEELKMINETNKILNLTDVEITATCVRVGVRNGHSVQIKLDFSVEVTYEQLKEILIDCESVKYIWDQSAYVTPRELVDTAQVFVSRIRLSPNKKSVLMFVVADNLRIGAATNTVNIAKVIMKGAQNV
ncbi:MAG: aspartate-semialdehyde dehydrogenase [Mycoplasmatales bacterium]